MNLIRIVWFEKYEKYCLQVISEYNNLPSETKLELEKEFCPVTLLKMRDSDESHKILDSLSSPF